MISNKDNKRKKIIKVFLCVLAVLVAFVAGAVVIYINDYYAADEEALLASSQAVQADSGVLVYEAEHSETGLIFYPGGKVQYESYAPLMQKCADAGITCVLIKMPGNLAILDTDAAGAIQKMFPEIKTWYIGGHSLGGAAASMHLAENLDEYEGLVLLAAYSTVDLRSSDIDVLSIYGSEDGVLNMEKYNECLANLPPDFTEFVIEGGCHSYFGLYGEQDGDGVAKITSEEQIEITSQQICNFTAEQ